MHLSVEAYGRWVAGEWTVDLQETVILEGLVGGLMHLATSGDEYRARLRATMRRKRRWRSNSRSWKVPSTSVMPGTADSGSTWSM